jgi:DNA-binding NarL/FixJ family response regulator
MPSEYNQWSTRLSPRERGVALLVAGGLSNKEIARELHLSDGTVKIHVHHILVKLKTVNRISLSLLVGGKKELLLLKPTPSPSLVPRSKPD